MYIPIHQESSRMQFRQEKRFTIVSLMVSRNIQHISDCSKSWKIVSKKVVMFSLAPESANQCDVSLILYKNVPL